MPHSTEAVEEGAGQQQRPLAAWPAAKRRRPPLQNTPPADGYLTSPSSPPSPTQDHLHCYDSHSQRLNEQLSEDLVASQREAQRLRQQAAAAQRAAEAAAAALRQAQQQLAAAQAAAAASAAGGRGEGEEHEAGRKLRQLEERWRHAEYALEEVRRRLL